MKFNLIPKKEWKIPKDLKRNFSKKRIEAILGSFSSITNDNVYMIDFRLQKIIVSNAFNPTISGYSKEMIKKEGFRIYNRILQSNEQKWLMKMSEDAYRIFYSYDDIEKRLAFLFSYDVVAKAKDGREVTLYHRLIPYQLCSNGNMWLAICVISSNTLSLKATKACIDNRITSKRYNYIDGKFRLEKQKHLTQDELTILKYLANGAMLKQIGDKLNVHQRYVDRKQKNALKKLGATTPAMAIYRATNMGLI